MRVAGLSAEGRTLRVAIVEGMFGLTRPVCSEELELPEDAAARPQAINEMLAAIRTRHRVGGVVIGLDFRDFTHNYIELPCMSRADVARALEYEMEKHLPLPPDEYLYDFVTVASTEDTCTNLVVSIKREKVAWVAECMGGTGLMLLGVRCNAFEALNEFLQRVRGDGVVFHYPEGHASFIFGLRGRMPTVLRSAYSESKVAALMDNLSGRMTGGLYSGEWHARDSLRGLDVSFLGYSIPHLLASSALRRRPLRLDFTPEALRPPRVDYVERATYALAALAAFLVVVTSGLSYYKAFAALQDVNSRIAEIKMTSSELLAVRRELEDMDKKRLFLAERQRRSNRYIAVLRRMSIALPEDAWLTSLKAGDKGVVEIEGYARRTADLIRPLEESDMFKNVGFSAPVSVRDNMEKFALRMELAQ